MLLCLLSHPRTCAIENLPDEAAWSVSESLSSRLRQATPGSGCYGFFFFRGSGFRLTVTFTVTAFLLQALGFRDTTVTVTGGLMFRKK